MSEQETRSPLRSGWFCVTVGAWFLTALAGLLGAADPQGIAVAAHVPTAAWLPLLQVGATLAIVERLRPLAWSWLAGPPLLLGAAWVLLARPWMLEPTLLPLLTLSLVGPTLGLLLFATWRDRAWALLLHLALLAVVTGLAVVPLLAARGQTTELAVHDTLYITGIRHAAAIPPLVTLAAAVAVRWRPWLALMPAAMVFAGALRLVLGELNAGLAGVPARYPLLEQSPVAETLLGGVILLAAVGALVLVAAWPVRPPDR